MGREKKLGTAAKYRTMLIEAIDLIQSNGIESDSTNHFGCQKWEGREKRRGGIPQRVPIMANVNLAEKASQPGLLTRVNYIHFGFGRWHQQLSGVFSKNPMAVAKNPGVHVSE